MIRLSVDKVRAALLALLVLTLAGLPGPARGQSVPPDGEWRTLETPHFRVTHRPALEALARRAGARAEEAWTALARDLTEPPEGKVDIVLTDHADISNGLTNVFPSNRIVLFAPPPVEGYELSYFDDWLDLVVVHELAHVFHLDTAGPLGRAVRTVFGRIPAAWPAFPGLALPTWAIEGLPTWYESSLTGAGRVHGSFNEMVVRTAVVEHRFEDLGQVSGESPVWPGGNRPYAYGSLFFDHLQERHGPERFGAFVDAVADQWVPYRLDAAARDAFGVSFSREWEAWRAGLEARYRALEDTLAERAPITRGEPLTRSGRLTLYPRPSPDGERLAWARSDGRSPPQLRLGRPDGSDGERWVETNTVGHFSWHPDGGVVLSQLEFADPYRIYGDLYRVDADGGVRRLTRDARLDHPDVAPGGRRAVAVQEGGGTTRLVEVELETGAVRILAGEGVDEHWAYPRISPDGRWIAASRWSPGGLYDVVVTDRAGRVVAEVTRDRAVDIAPAWGGDGRWLLWSSDRTGIPNLFAVPVDPARGAVGEVRQVTNVLTGASYPAVDPRGRWIFYSAYHADGWDVERIPFEPEAWFEPAPTVPAFRGPSPAVAAEAAERLAGGVGAPSERYGPARSLLPRYWVPLLDLSDGSAEETVLGTGLGARTGGVDLVGRHRYGVAALYYPSEGRWSGAGVYTWAGLGNPVVSVGVSQAWDPAGPFFAEDADGMPATLYVAERERRVDLSVSLARRRVRSSASVAVGGGVVWEDRSVLEADGTPSSRFRLDRPEGRLLEARASLSYGTARGFAFSVGLQEGWAGFVRTRVRRQVALADSLRNVVGGDRSFQEVAGQLRAYLPIPGPGYAPHVLALRASGGAAAGAGADRFHFDLGGASGTAEGITGFGLAGGTGLLFPLRGYDRDVRSGRYAWSATAEYRVPVTLVHEGWGLVPLHLDRVSAATFVDAGNAWGPELGVSGFQNPRGDMLWSAGAEVLLRGLPLWTSPVTLRLGVAWPLVELPEGGGDGVSFYLRLGPSF